MPNEQIEMLDACIDAKVVESKDKAVWLEVEKKSLHERRGYKAVKLDGEPVVVDDLQLYAK